MRTSRLAAAVSAIATAALAATALAVAAPSAAAAPGDERVLADRYAPVVRLVAQPDACGPGEPFVPTDVAAVLDDEGVALRGPWTTDDLVKIGPGAEDLGRGLAGHHLDFPGDPLDPGCTYEQWSDAITQGSRPTTYARVVTEEGREGLALQYWLYYPFNDFNNKHESDWEMVQLEFAASDAASALGEEPTRVGYSQHEGVEVAEWGDVKLEVVDGTHPVVHPAAGSHANYYDAALFLGRSGQQGFGCDDTRGDAARPPARRRARAVRRLGGRRRVPVARLHRAVGAAGVELLQRADRSEHQGPVDGPAVVDRGRGCALQLRRPRERSVRHPGHERLLRRRRRRVGRAAAGPGQPRPGPRGAHGARPARRVARPEDDVAAVGAAAARAPPLDGSGAVVGAADVPPAAAPVRRHRGPDRRHDDPSGSGPGVDHLHRRSRSAGRARSTAPSSSSRECSWPPWRRSRSSSARRRSASPSGSSTPGGRWGSSAPTPAPCGAVHPCCSRRRPTPSSSWACLLTWVLTPVALVVLVAGLLLMPVVVLEGSWGWAAFRRSAQLVRPHWVKVVVLVALTTGDRARDRAGARHDAHPRDLPALRREQRRRRASSTRSSCPSSRSTTSTSTPTPSSARSSSRRSGGSPSCRPRPRCR